MRRAARTWLGVLACVAGLMASSAMAQPSSPTPPPVPHAWRAEADALFGEGLALAQVARHAAAAAKFLAAAARDPGRVDAVLRAGLALRRAGDLDAALVAYGRALGHPAATPGDHLDATYGLAETHRLRGDVDEAIELFARYVAGETRPDEERYVKRARAAIAALRGAPETTATSPASVHFFGDRVLVEELLAEAESLRATGDDAGAAARLQRARAIAPADNRVPLAPSTTCDPERLQAAGEQALAAGDGEGARAAFQQSRACDPTRAAPLWGLSRAADLVGDRAGGRAHALRYLRARAPDQQPALTRAAWWRAEQPE